MAIPKIFVSSTYYDLMHVRNDIEVFITGLGYEPVLHERHRVAYTQTDTLEESCYREIENCEILICIIGNKFGTESNTHNYSITMKELQTAINQQKKVYAFIQKDVSVENRTYLANKENKDFTSAVVNDLRVHEFIADLKETVKTFPINDFESVHDIIDSLRSQFAGLFQSLLQRETTLIEGKSLQDLNSVTSDLGSVVAKVESTNQEIANFLSSTLFITHQVTQKLLEILSMSKSDFRVQLYNKKGMISFIEAVGFSKVEDPFDEIYERVIANTKQRIEISDDIFDKQGNLHRYVDTEVVEKAFLFEEQTLNDIDIDDDDLPF